MRIAVIPARGGSKRIPGKNIKNFCGKPIIAWSIEAALASNCFDSVIVSTDDNLIAAVSYEYGAEIPFIRPKELSDDHTGIAEVMEHAIEWFRLHGKKVNEVCCIFATAPFLLPQDIQRGLKILLEGNALYAFSAASYEFPIQRAFRKNGFNRVEMLNPEHFLSRSQDLEDFYHDAGQFYWGVVNAWVEKIPVFSEDAIPIIFPRNRVQDIDTLEDWEFAEKLFKTINAGPAQ